MGADMAHSHAPAAAATGATRTNGGHRSAVSSREGLITGFLLKLIRESAGLTQEALAEQLRVDRNTIQGWETGRRSLTGTRGTTLVQVRHRLRQLGADPQLLGVLDDAAEADFVLAHVLATEPGDSRPVDHPLSRWVLRRSFAYVLAWPFTGQLPVALQPHPSPSRRGPVAPAPAVTAEERARFFQHLRRTVDESLADRDLEEASGLCFDATPTTCCRGTRAARRQPGSGSWSSARSVGSADSTPGRRPGQPPDRWSLLAPAEATRSPFAISSVPPSALTPAKPPASPIGPIGSARHPRPTAPMSSWPATSAHGRAPGSCVDSPPTWSLTNRWPTLCPFALGAPAATRASP
jgi:DNA-binding transcriptional regulator YiaG